jgi:6-pyruvoyltetrahydropterin/6-carboxytetrahydropterin synthase
VIGNPISDNTNPKWGMVIDFGDLKKIVNREIVDVFDHAVIFNKNTPHADLGNILMEHGHNVILTDYQPSSENMVLDFVDKIKGKLPEGVELFSLRLQETETSVAEWYASDNA